MSRYKILIFDLDDTLIDNVENTRTGFRHMMTAHGGGYSDAKFARWREINEKFWRDYQDGLIVIPEKFRKEKAYDRKSQSYLNWIRSQRVSIFFNHKISAKRAIELSNIYLSALTETIIPIKGAAEILQYLSEHGYKIIVATNGPSNATQCKVDGIGATEYIAEILSADMFGCSKPNPRFFAGIEEHYHDFKKSDYLIIGDSLKSDIGLAMNVGIDSCWLNSSAEQLTDEYKPTYIIKQLAELRAIL